MSEDSASKKEFETFLGGLRLKSIWMKSCDAMVSDREKLTTRGAKIKIEIGTASKLVSATENHAEVSVLVGVRVFDIEEKRKQLALISVTYTLKYETETQMTEALFELFRRTSLHMQVMPFAREWIHHQSSQMGIIPVLIPLSVFTPAAKRTSRPRPVAKVLPNSGKVLDSGGKD